MSIGFNGFSEQPYTSFLINVSMSITGFSVHPTKKMMLARDKGRRDLSFLLRLANRAI